ncbi:MAG TPA: SPOR domain-containing protein [Steroidobacteraceae bacterium]|nr:SPOR domain-containing protein [Steroidobacteraceae bacterium]
MVTFQAGRAALAMLLVLAVGACSGEQQDWLSAESADTGEAWQRFIEQHPDSELVNEARRRLDQLEARRDFEHADRIGTLDAYRNFLAHHPSGKWSEHARIRIESFSFGSAPRLAPPTAEEAAAVRDSAVRALHLATAPPALAPVPAQDGAPLAGERQAEPQAIPVSAVPAEPVAYQEDGAAQPASAHAVPGEAAQVAEDVVLTPRSATAEVVQGAYGVQLGAFGSEASADREWRRLQGRFGTELANLSPRIVIAESDSHQLYRLQVPASGEAEARAICDSLREQDQACIPVVPR